MKYINYINNMHICRNDIMYDTKMKTSIYKL